VGVPTIDTVIMHVSLCLPWRREVLTVERKKKKTKQTGILKFRFEFVVCFGGFFELD